MFIFFILITCLAQATIAAPIKGRNLESEAYSELSWESKNEINKYWKARGMQVNSSKGPDLFARTEADSNLFLQKSLTIPGGEEIRIRMAVNKGSFTQLFWNYPYKQSNSIKLPLIADGKIHEYRFQAPYDLIGKLRFDPTDKRASIQIESIVIPTVGNRKILVRSVYWNHSQLVSGKWQRLSIILENTENHVSEVDIHIDAPDTVEIKNAKQQKLYFGRTAKKLKSIPEIGQYHIMEGSWQIRSTKPREVKLRITVLRSDGTKSNLTVVAKFGKSKITQNVEYIPPPTATPTRYLIGAHYFPGWKEGTHFGWSRIAPYPNRVPLLGKYDEGSPEVADWEIKWALEHGMSFFIYNWFRVKGNEGRPVQTRIEHALHDGFFNAKFRDKFKFSIMFANAKRTGISGPQDLLRNVLPFWIENYFRHPSYLIINNKPVVAIHQWKKFEKRLGRTPEQIAQTMREVQQLLRKSGFDGIWLLANQRPTSLTRANKKAFDYTISWQGANDTIRRVNTSSSHIPTVSTRFSSEPWGGKSKFRLTPGKFKNKLFKAKKRMDKLPPDHLGHRLLLIDHWNEWGEGHYIAPHREHRFGYLDAIRDVFTDSPKAHQDLVPEDVGLGPYEMRYREALQSQITNIYNDRAKDNSND